MLQISPAAVMFIFTVAFASVFLIPATSYSPKNSVVSFYWRGLWTFLSAICAVSGAAQTLYMMGVPAQATGEAFLQALLLTFILFVVFAWFRLAGKAAFYGIQRFLGKFKQA